jgi:predicted anti-sigma-YlaC factor YlaD
MTHETAQQHWVDYIEGKLDGAGQQQLDAHMAGCLECRGAFAEFRAWHETLRTEGSRMREAFYKPQADIEQMLAQSLERISAVRPAGSARTIADVMAALRSLLEPVFGQGTMAAAIDAALLKSGAVVENLGAANWESFVADLSEAISSVCGLTAGRLVALAGGSFGHGLAGGRS